MFNAFFQHPGNSNNNPFRFFEQMGNGYAFPFEEGIPPTPSTTKPPPASRRAINSLSMVQVTADDLIEETNKECLICLEEQMIGTMSCKLPCGHLFHKDCLTEWLVKQCTCPVCRYELETEDSTFETSRRQRMKDRKLRYRKDELKTKTIYQLKEICAKLSISTNDCLDKQEVVDKIIRSGKVIITDGAPAIEMTEKELLQKNVGELKHLLLTFGLSCDGALEKSELRERLIQSGRIVIVDAAAASKSAAPVNASSSNLKSGSTETDVRKASSSGSDCPKESSAISYSREDLRNMSLTGLRELCRRYRINTSDCLDKSEVIDAMIKSRNFPIRIDTASQFDKEFERTFPQERNYPSSPSNFIRSRSNSQENAMEKTQTKIPKATNATSESSHSDPYDQAFSFINEIITTAANDISTHVQAMYQQAYESVSTPQTPNPPPPQVEHGPNPSQSTNPIQSPQHPLEMRETIPTATTSEPNPELLTFTRELIESFNISELKMILESYGLNSDGCVDRFDHIQLLQSCPQIQIIE